jgi:5-methylcytosine-specific restriction endonuclease McrA
VSGTKRGTSNGNSAGSAEDRRRRKQWLLDTYRANVDGVPSPSGVVVAVEYGAGEKVCRCYRCGDLLTFELLTVDRIIPGCQGGTYKRSNVRPCCGPCNSETGGATRAKPATKRRRDAVLQPGVPNVA